MPRVRGPPLALVADPMENAHTSQHAKRAALEKVQTDGDVAGQPSRKRAALGDLTNVN